jgi:hypothetical protein
MATQFRIEVERPILIVISSFWSFDPSIVKSTMRTAPKEARISQFFNSKRI